MLGFVLDADPEKFKSLALKGKSRSKVIEQVGGSIFFSRSRSEFENLLVFTKAQNF